MTKELKGDRWTCPNDRNLQLRSKLNAGWSIHTGKKSVKKDPQLTEAELIEIQKVLQRSEILEKNERDRVMLENMKRNATQSSCSLSSNRCSLCGDYFCLIRTAPTQCNSCRKILCNKCCIDTECTVENDLTCKTLQSRKNSSNNLSVTNGLIGTASNFSKTLYLCRICSEQREFLKKSGVWFLKKFPNYLTDGINTKLKLTSTTNSNQNENLKISPTEIKSNFFISPTTLKRNISVSSSSSLSFRIWKFKEGCANDGFDYTDNMSDYSVDNDKNEILNCECNKTKTQFKENSNQKSPTSNNKIYETFQFNMSSYDSQKDSENLNSKFLKKANNSPINPSVASQIKSHSTNLSENFENKKKNSLNIISSNNDIPDDFIKISSNQQKTNQLKSNTEFLNSNISTIKSQKDYLSKDSNHISDDDSVSSNMESYNYYSKIIINMNMTSEKKKEINSLSTRLSEEKPMIEDFPKKLDAKNLKNEFRSKNRSISSITDEVFNNSLSVSASNLNLESNFEKNRMLQNKCVTAKLSRKNRNEEWCTRKLSNDHDSSSDLLDCKNLKIKKIQQLASSCSENTGSSLTVNGVRSKISSHMINSLAKKISSQNTSAIDLVAGHSSIAVHSASSLATSLSNINLQS